MHPDVTPLLLTYNEEANLDRVLARLRGASRVVVVDSHSTDETIAIAARFPNVHVVQRRFDTHDAQWNFGLAQVDTPWALALDADYVLDDALLGELAAPPGIAGESGYVARFRYCIDGHPLRASLYPSKVVLFRVADGRYVADGHTQTLELRGATGHLRGCIHHDDRKPLARWLASQDRYAELEVNKLFATGGAHSRIDRLRRLGWLVPLLTPVYCLVVRGLWREGRRGLLYTMQRTYAELLLALKIVHRRFASAPDDT